MLPRGKGTGEEKSGRRAIETIVYRWVPTGSTGASSLAASASTAAAAAAVATGAPSSAPSSSSLLVYSSEDIAPPSSVFLFCFAAEFSVLAEPRTGTSWEVAGGGGGCLGRPHGSVSSQCTAKAQVLRKRAQLCQVLGSMPPSERSGQAVGSRENQVPRQLTLASVPPSFVWQTLQTRSGLAWFKTACVRASGYAKPKTCRQGPPWGIRCSSRSRSGKHATVEGSRRRIEEDEGGRDGK